MIMTKKFGQILKEFRLESGYGLRRFAELIEMPPSNYSDIEHGRRNLPENFIKPVADALGLQKGTEQWNIFFDLAAKDGDLPHDIKQIASSEFIPVLLRTIDNRQLSDKEIKNLIEDIRERR